MKATSTSAGTPAATPVLRVRDLHVGTDREPSLPLVRGVSFDLAAGEILGVVGESGSGKSLTALSVLGLLPDGVGIRGGQVLFDDEDLVRADADRLRAIRGRRIALVSQDPGRALNPVQRIGRQVAEPMVIHDRLPRQVRRERVVSTLEQVGISDAAGRLASYPFEFSGGMRQRAMISMALVCRPAVLIADEPTTGLDVTVQLQVLALIRSLATELAMSTLLISHDLRLIAGICDRVQVMYAGEIVESGPTAEVLADPRHPYTKALVRAVPSKETEPGSTLYALPGVPAEPSLTRTGCSLFPRCAERHERCAAEEPRLRTVAPGHMAACWVTQAGVSLDDQ